MYPSIQKGVNLMTREYYVLHYFDFKNSGKFFLVAFFGLILILAIILTFARIQSVRQKKKLLSIVPSFILGKEVLNSSPIRYLRD